MLFIMLANYSIRPPKTRMKYPRGWFKTVSKQILFFFHISPRDNLTSIYDVGYLVTIWYLLNIGKRRRKEKDKSGDGKDSSDGPEVSSEVSNIGSYKVSVLGDVGNGEVSWLNHHLGLSARSEGGASNCWIKWERRMKIISKYMFDKGNWFPNLR